jgi:lipid-A-disaccharide synthase
MPAPGLRIAIVAGETSGDALGAALIEALRARVAGVEFTGVAGPKMRAAGCEALADAHELSVMGLTDVLPHLPRLLRLRARLVREIVARAPQLFIGVDYQQFNLGLAPGSRAHHRARVRSGAVPAALRTRVLP